MRSWLAYLSDRLSTCLAILLLPAVSLGAQSEPVITHQALECLPNNQFPQLDATIRPGTDVQTAKVYFRSALHPDFYYVLMNRPAGANSPDLFQAILPMPSPETAKVIYYIEAVSQAYHSARTAESLSDVASDSDCKRRDPAAAFFTGERPGIVVGATRAGAPSVPPGFQAAGIVSFVSAAGVTSGTGGGIGAGTGVLIAAGAAAAVGGAVAAGGGGSTTSVPLPPAAPTTTTTTVAPTTTTTSVPPFNEAPKACFTFSPDPPLINEGDSITFDASCSAGDRTLKEDNAVLYEWDFGDGEGARGRRVTHTYLRPGFFVCVLTVTDEGGKQDQARINVHVETNVKACFTVTNIGGDLNCDVIYNASCSTGKISRYDWVFDTTGQLFGPFPFPDAGPVITKNFPPCPSFPIPSTHELTVYGPGNIQSKTSQTFIVAYLRGPEEGALHTGFSSFLDLHSAEPGVRAQLLVNGEALGPADAAQTQQHRFKAKAGENTVEAYLSGGEAEGTWRFDFSSAERFAPGSIRVDSGQVVSLDGRSVVFRVGESIKFGFHISP
jgi:hypothetical protein